VANLELPSFIALAAFFAGGLLGTFFIVPIALRCQTFRTPTDGA
jgi:hypothetical protein